jgi:CheY-like chemotaxis protein
MALVLLVEDHADSADMVAGLLRKRSHVVLVAPNGAAALKLLVDGFFPDVVLLDLQMPIMDGVTFLDIFRSFEIYRAVPVVVISALSSCQSTELSQYRVVSVLTKGRVDLTALGESIDRLDHKLAQAGPAMV